MGDCSLKRSPANSVRGAARRAIVRRRRPLGPGFSQGFWNFGYDPEARLIFNSLFESPLPSALQERLPTLLPSPPTTVASVASGAVPHSQPAGASRLDQPSNQQFDPAAPGEARPLPPPSPVALRFQPLNPLFRYCRVPCRLFRRQHPATPLTKGKGGKGTARIGSIGFPYGSQFGIGIKKGIGNGINQPLLTRVPAN